jgi:hypothetical protein
LPAGRRRYDSRLDKLQRPRFELLVINVQPGQLLPGFGEGPKHILVMLRHRPTVILSAAKNPCICVPSTTGVLRRFAPQNDSAHERNARQFALQVLGVFRAVFGMVQNPVDVIEDVPLGDFLVLVMLAEMFQRPVGDVLAAIRTLLSPKPVLGLSNKRFYTSVPLERSCAV